MTLPQYEIFALRYGTMAKRSRRENFITQDPHDEPMPMDYFVWVVRNAERTILVDTGFSARQAKERGRTLLRCPIESLSLLGIAPGDIQDVVLTHLHYDHAGNIDLLPNARFHVQDGEVDYACGRHMCHGLFRHAYDVEDVVSLVRRLYANRVVFHDGREELAPGIELIKIGGHTKGLQSCVCIRHAAGWCWPPMRAITTTIWKSLRLSRLCFILVRCWRVTTPCVRPLRRPSTSFRVTIRRCVSAILSMAIRLTISWPCICLPRLNRLNVSGSLVGVTVQEVGKPCKRPLNGLQLRCF